ncbi:biotin/lipoyl-binding protein [Aporhodopirellula aestuarii]|uniref:Biotin/lipoyl-binding protein n=1 Tax=Aporhodopirellula aestuarii TaxID=2950107 RepID=A0ABT0U0H9_9BACT|nr:biotin/lipoyl-binding protein [Aporhodopirellula aestuarii]MCM2369998.1 biotin/lipoyl-binding protein [Aporhodopirellula aestuarii]
MANAIEPAESSVTSGMDAATLFDSQTVDLMSVSPELRSDLSVVRHSYRGTPCYMLEDLASGRSHRLGEVEFAFCSALNGHHTVEEAVALVAQKYGDDAISSDEALNLLGWLVDSGLIHNRSRQAAAGVSDAQTRLDRVRGRVSIGALFQKVRLGNPDRFIQSLTDAMSRSVCWAAMIAFGICLLIGSALAIGHWDQLTNQVFQSITADRWASLLLTFAGLKLLHELGHAVVCRSFGCAVRGCGLVFVLFLPMPFVDVSSSILLTSKWKRIGISVAGVAVEIWVASIAVIVFSLTRDPLTQLACMDVMIAASIVTLVFNLNPLMRFDGYYVLSDFLEIPNLASQGSQAVRAILGRTIWGGTLRWSDIPDPRGWILSYGVLAGIWRIGITITLMIAAVGLFSGWGILLVIAVVSKWLHQQISNFLQPFVDKELGSGGGIASKRIVLIGVVAVIFGGLAMTYPFSRTTTLPTSIRLLDTQTIRCSESGVVRKVLVQTGDQINQGDPICHLSSPELEFELAEVTSQLKSSENLLRRLHSRGDIASFQSELVRMETFKRHQRMLQRQQNSLTVISPHSGLIVDGNLDDLRGRFVKRGESICSIGNSQFAEVVAMLPADESLSWEVGSAHHATFWVEGQPDLPMRFSLHLDARQASDRVEYPELSVPLGGSLAVYGGGQGTEPRWVQPQLKLRAIIDLTTDDPHYPKILPGQVANCRIELQNRPFLSSIYGWWTDSGIASR